MRAEMKSLQAVCSYTGTTRNELQTVNVNLFVIRQRGHHNKRDCLGYVRVGNIQRFKIPRSSPTGPTLPLVRTFESTQGTNSDQLAYRLARTLGGENQPQVCHSFSCYK